MSAHRPDIMALAIEVVRELERAEAKHPGMNSPHEGWSVIFEELEDLREHVRADTGRSVDARKEAIQVAAMGMRYALNLCGPYPQFTRGSSGGDTHLEGAVAALEDDVAIRRVVEPPAILP